MFKKGVITDEISQDLEYAAKMAAEFGLTGLELRSVWNKGVHELTEEELDRVLQIARSYNLEIPAVSSPFFKCNLDSPQEIQEHYEILAKTIQAAKKLGAKIIRGFAFWRKGPDFDEKLPQIVEQFQKPIAMLKEAGMALALENEPSTYNCNAARTVQLLKALDSPQVRAVWDAGNDIYSLDEPERPYPEGYNIIKDYMIHMHMKDAVHDPETGKVEGVAIGTGQTNWRGQLKAILDDGYTGYLCLETHYRPVGKLSEEQLNRPGGADFSNLGDIASRECLENWFAIMKELS
jgi:L-ribulose-5-phosphate 3-epimerase